MLRSKRGESKRGFRAALTHYLQLQLCKLPARKLPACKLPAWTPASQLSQGHREHSLHRRHYLIRRVCRGCSLQILWGLVRWGRWRWVRPPRLRRRCISSEQHLLLPYLLTNSAH